ncbi:ligand-dependent nuclear receptor-interacting factor 1 [Elgaria multicarinata webbii]|uniref:ligand-dependent nuclear receptor-interacting factor 1 n=1 Tax=Elgaria multicarinata webbii TaxID=159646 RepID=UPI002FCCC39A
MAQGAGRSADGRGAGEGASGSAVSPCITGCIYQIVQTTGLDGKNLLKLLPVSKPLGNFMPFVQPPVIPDHTKANVSMSAHDNLKDVFVKTPEFKSAIPGKLILPKQVEKVNTTSMEEANRTTSKVSSIQSNFHSGDRSFLKKDAISVCSDKSNAEYVLVKTKNLPVTVKPPVLPSGHHLQIPADAEVKSVPASFLPPTIQQKILAAAASSASGTCEVTNTPTVIYVSPVKTVKTASSRTLQNICPEVVAEVSKSSILTMPETAADSSAQDMATSQSEEKQAAPMKWVVQENLQPSAPCLVPVKSSNHVASKILKTLVDMKDVKSNPASILPACSNSVGESQAKITSIKDNALVMYNGKVYLLTKKESSVVSANKYGKQASPSAETHFRKQTSQLISSAADSTITNQVVSLVLSKSKGFASIGKDTKSSENMGPCPQSEGNLGIKAATTFFSSPHGNLQVSSTSQHESVSRSGNIPVGMNVAQKPISRGNEYHNIQKKISPKAAAALLPAIVDDASKEEEQKVDKISSGMAIQIKHRKEQNGKQDLELRKKFGLSKEERVYLRKIPLPNTFARSGTILCSNSVQMTDSCNLLQEVPTKPEPREEERILGEQREENIKSETKTPPMLANTKRRKTEDNIKLNPNLECTNSYSVMDYQSSPCRQVVSQQENPASFLQFSQKVDCDPRSCVQSNEENNTLTPTSPCCENETFFSEDSFREDIFPFSPPDLEETIKDEKITRLKFLLREREAELEEIRKKMQQT